MSGRQAINAIYSAVIGLEHLAVGDGRQSGSGRVSVFVEQLNRYVLFDCRFVVGIRDSSRDYSAAHKFEIDIADFLTRCQDDIFA